MNFNYEIINEEFENDKVSHSQILNFNSLKTIMKFDLNSNLKIFNLPNNKFKPISNFQMKQWFPNMALIFSSLKRLKP